MFDYDFKYCILIYSWSFVVSMQMREGVFDLAMNERPAHAKQYCSLMQHLVLLVCDTPTGQFLRHEIACIKISKLQINVV